MRFVVLGAGQMGRAAVHDLARIEGVEEVIVVDRLVERAEEVARDFGRGVARAEAMDISNQAALRELLAPAIACLGATSYTMNQSVSRTCIQVGTHYVDLGGNNEVVRKQFAMSSEAEEASVALVPDCGLAPGLVSILVARCLELQPSTHTIRMRVGGLPLHPKPPFKYHVVFSVEGLINEYREPTLCLRDGEVMSVPSLSELEMVEFPPPFGRLEAFTTSGGASTLPYTMKGKVRNLDYKTIRYPGHCQLIQGLFALGFDRDDEDDIDGVLLRPRRVLEHRMMDTLRDDGPDVVLLLVEAEGPSGKVGFRLVDTFDEHTGLTAMARCTSFSACVILHMLATGRITERGTLHQEVAVPAGDFVDALRRRGIDLREERGDSIGEEYLTLW